VTANGEQSDEFTFSVGGGFEMHRLLNERDLYNQLHSLLGLSALLDFSLHSDSLTVVLRRPSGTPLDVLVPDPATRERVLQHLILVERHLPQAFRHLRPSQVFARAGGEIDLHGAILGWHGSEPDLASQSSLWLDAFVHDSGEPLVLSGFVELRAVVAPDRQGSADDISARVQRLRRQARGLVATRPDQAAQLLIDALRIRPDHDLLVLALDAAMRARSVELFDQALAAGSTTAALSAPLAWRALQAGALVQAEAFARAGISTDAERALEVLLDAIIRRGELREAGEVAVDLLLRYSSLERLRKGLWIAHKTRQDSLARRIFSAYTLPVEDATCLLFRAELELREGDSRRAFGTLLTLSQEGVQVTEQVAQRAVDVAEQATLMRQIGERTERLLPLLVSLRARVPESQALTIAEVFYCLGGNLHARAAGLLPLLSEGGPKWHMQALLAFRDGDYATSLEHGAAALYDGIDDPDLASTLAEACRLSRSRPALAKIAALATPIIRGFPTVAEKFDEVRKELGRG